jgi:hypothetical protein
VIVRKVGGPDVWGWVWVGPEATSIQCGVELEPGEYEFEVVAHTPDGEAHRIIRFVVYSPCPVIQEVGIHRDHYRKDDGSVKWTDHLRASASDGDGASDVVGITTVDPEGALHPQYGIDDVSEQELSPYVLEVSWTSPERDTQLAAGVFEVTATDSLGNSDIAATDPLPPGLTATPVITYPAWHSTIPETVPTLTWEPYGTGDGRPVSMYMVRVWRDGGDMWEAWVSPDVTSVEYNFDGTAPDATLVPGAVCNMWLEAWIDAPEQSDPRVHVVEIAGTTHRFLVADAGQEPVIYGVVAACGYGVSADGTEYWERWVHGATRDPLGNGNIGSIVITDPDMVDHPADETWDPGTWPENLEFWFWEAPPDPTSIGGTYTVTVTNDQGCSASESVSMTAPPTSVPVITSPTNGEVLVDVTRPVFEWDPYPGADGYWLMLREVGGAVVLDWFWVGPELTQTECAVDLAPGEYEFEVVASVPGAGEAHRIIRFVIYSPVPAIERIDLDRGRDIEIDGSVVYHERAWVTITDCDGMGDIQSVMITDTEGNSNACQLSEDWGTGGVFYWDDWATPGPPPSGAYTLEVMDAAGHSASITTAATPPVCELSPGILSPAANDSIVNDTTPVFSWTEGIPGEWHSLSVWGGANGGTFWECGAYGAGSVEYDWDGTAVQPELAPGYTYDWHINVWRSRGRCLSHLGAGRTSSRETLAIGRSRMSTSQRGASRRTATRWSTTCGIAA